MTTAALIEIAIPDITPKVLGEKSDRQLLDTHRRLHQLWGNLEKGAALNREDLVNAEIFVLIEFKKRGFKHRAEDGLTRQVRKLDPGVLRDVQESSLKTDVVHDEARTRRVFDALKDRVLIKNFVSVRECDGELIVQIKCEAQDPRLDLNLYRMIERATGKVPEFLRTAKAPVDNATPLYDLVLRKKAVFEMKEVGDGDSKIQIHESADLVERARLGIQDFVVVTDFVSLTGSFVYHNPNREPGDCDIVLKSFTIDDNLTQVLDDEIAEAAGKDLHWVWEPRGPNWDSVPLYDLVCVRVGAVMSEASPDRKAWCVFWADHRGVQIFEEKEDAEACCKAFHERGDKDASIIHRNVPRYRDGRLFRVQKKFTGLSEAEPMEEAFHLRDIHWVPVPEDGSCPTTHPNKLKFPGTDTLRCFTASAAAQVRAMREAEHAEKLANERAKLRAADPDNKGERCGLCQYFQEPTTCKVVVGPVAADQVCDWIQSRDVKDFPSYKVSDDDWVAFVKGMVNKQPYQHIVKDGALTPAGPLVMIEDTADPKHRFSLTKVFHLGHTNLEHHWTQAEVDKLVKLGKELQESELEEGIRPAFGSPGGKKLLARTIAALIPDHEKYVEPFIGGGAVFFMKEPSRNEVISDTDRGISSAYQFMQSATDQDIQALLKKPINYSKERFHELRNHVSSGRIDEFYTFLYLKAFSFGKDPDSGTAPGAYEGKSLEQRIELIPKIRERLKGISILNEDFRTVIRRHDGPGTVFYLDPPYPEQQAKLKTDLVHEQIERTVRGIKGKFILSLPDTKSIRDIFKRFNIRGVSVRRMMDKKSEHTDGEVLIANFSLQKQRLAASVEEIGVMVIGRHRKPGGWGVSNNPKAPDKPLIGREAQKAFRRLQEGQRAWIYRVAVRDDSDLVALDAEKNLMRSDLELRWVVRGLNDPLTGLVASKSEWRGTGDPQLWQMGRGFRNRPVGEMAYASTFISALQPEPKIGDVIAMNPVLSVRNLRAGIHEPDTIDVIREVIGATNRPLAIQEAGRLPNQTEQRQALERRIGDWFMVKQPQRQTFSAVHQIHIRGIWSKDQRRDILKTIRDTNKLPIPERAKALEDLWKKWDMNIVTIPLAQLKKRAQRIADGDGDVGAAVKSVMRNSFPGPAEFNRLLQKDRIVNRANAHTEFRIEAPGKENLFGWTLDTPGSMLQYLRTGRLEAVLRNKLTDIRELEKGLENILVQKKSPQPLTWLTLVGPRRREFEAAPGLVGATAETAGLFKYITGGSAKNLRVVFGVQKSDFHEYFVFYDDPVFKRRLGGRWGYQLIQAKGELAKDPEKQIWLANKPKDQRPYLFTHDYEKERDKAEKDKIDVNWNFDTIAELERLGYFGTTELKEALEEWKTTERGKIPKKEELTFRPKGARTEAPSIFSESLSAGG